MNCATKILWIDCIGGMTAGIVVTLFHAWFSDFYGLPVMFIVFVGVMNFAYGMFSFSLAIREIRPFWLFCILVIGNILWGILCVVWVFKYLNTASIFGLAHLILEAVFVAGLGVFEWLYRSNLSLAR